MPKLPPFDRVATDILILQSQGRYPEALALILSELNSGTASAKVQAIAADLLRPKAPGGRRGPKKKEPFDWYNIGQRYDELREAGTSDTEARMILADTAGRGKRTIDSILAYYNRAMNEYRAEDAAHDEWLAEQSRK